MIPRLPPISLRPGRTASEWFVRDNAPAAVQAESVPPKDGKPLSQIIKSVEAQKAGIISEVEFDDGFWELARWPEYCAAGMSWT